MHDVVRDVLGDIAAMAYEGVLTDPIVRVADLDGKIPVLTAEWDILIHGSHRLRHCSIYVFLTMMPILIAIKHSPSNTGIS